MSGHRRTYYVPTLQEVYERMLSAEPDSDYSVSLPGFLGACARIRIPWVRLGVHLEAYTYSREDGRKLAAFLEVIERKNVEPPVRGGSDGYRVRWAA